MAGRNYRILLPEFDNDGKCVFARIDADFFYPSACIRVYLRPIYRLGDAGIVNRCATFGGSSFSPLLCFLAFPAT